MITSSEVCLRVLCLVFVELVVNASASVSDTEICLDAVIGRTVQSMGLIACLDRPKSVCVGSAAAGPVHAPGG